MGILTISDAFTLNRRNIRVICHEELTCSCGRGAEKRPSMTGPPDSRTGKAMVLCSGVVTSTLDASCSLPRVGEQLPVDDDGEKQGSKKESSLS